MHVLLMMPVIGGIGYVIGVGWGHCRVLALDQAMSITNQGSDAR